MMNIVIYGLPIYLYMAMNDRNISSVWCPQYSLCR